MSTRVSAFEQTAANQSSTTLLGELWRFVRCNKKWWLLPILFILLAFSVLMLLSTSAAAPFIYTLF